MFCFVLFFPYGTKVTSNKKTNWTPSKSETLPVKSENTEALLRYAKENNQVLSEYAPEYKFRCIKIVVLFTQMLRFVNLIIKNKQV